MKTQKSNSKLSLNKQTIAKLNEAQMNDVQGGSSTACISVSLMLSSNRCLDGLFSRPI